MNTSAPRVRIIAASITAIFGVAMLSQTAFAQTAATPPAPAKVEKIQVTGSNIKRVDDETAAPVQIITRYSRATSG
jgi:iron complex outermembrane recepter protein